MSLIYWTYHKSYIYLLTHISFNIIRIILYKRNRLDWFDFHIQLFQNYTSLKTNNQLITVCLASSIASSTKISFYLFFSSLLTSNWIPLTLFTLFFTATSIILILNSNILLSYIIYIQSFYCNPIIHQETWKCHIRRLGLTVLFKWLDCKISCLNL